MRQRFMFWLDHDKIQEKQIAEDIQSLKKRGMFASTIRDGIRLIQSLRQGRVDVLLALFPWIEAHFRQPSIPAGIPQHDPLRDQIDTLTQLLLKQGATPVDMPPKPKSASVSRLKPDDLIQVTNAQKDADNNSAWNFMIASALQIYGNYTGLPPDVIEYGIRTGRIKEKPTKDSGPKAMKVPQFTAPAFDDVEL